MTRNELTEHGLSVSWEHVTPEIAADYLGGPKKNYRKLNDRIVRKYAAIIDNGNWTPGSGGTISFDRSGNLVNGQHRMEAVVRSGSGIDVLKITGVTHVDIQSTDTGVSRRVQDYLASIGEKNSTKLSAVCRMLHSAELGKSPFSSETGRMLDIPTCLEILRRWPGTQGHVKAGGLSQGIIPTSIAAFVTLWGGAEVGWGRRRSESAARMFCRGVGTQCNEDDDALGAGDPRLALGRRLAKSRRHSSSPTRKYIFAITIKAWNAYVSSRPMNRVSWSESGERPEAFPEFCTGDDID